MRLIKIGLVASLILGLIVLFFPFPHGNIFEVVVHQIFKSSVETEYLPEIAKQVQFAEAAKQRFHTPLDPKDFSEAWLDQHNGLLWSPDLNLQLSDWSPESWKKAQSACAEKWPLRSWALPTMAEYLKAKKHSPTQFQGRYIASLIIDAGSFPAVFSNGNQNSALRVRCIARTKAAPEAGILEPNY